MTDSTSQSPLGPEKNLAYPLTLTSIQEARDQLSQLGQPVRTLLAALLNEQAQRGSEAASRCLQQMKKHFEKRGIVEIDPNGTERSYRAALRIDKTAGRTWGGIETRFQSNPDLLWRAAAMPGGAHVIGVYPDESLAIRQASPDIVNGRWTVDVLEKRGEGDIGELLLLARADARALPKGRWANPIEMLQAIKKAGYSVPSLPSNHNANAVIGLVAASQVVTGDPYVMNPSGKEFHQAILEWDQDSGYKSGMPTILWSNAYDGAPYSVRVSRDYLDIGNPTTGAVLWVMG